MGKTNTAYKFRIYPSEEQQHFLAKNFGCCRFVYNQALNWRSLAYNADGTSLNYGDTAYGLTRIKGMYPWLKEADSASLQQSLKRLDQAFTNFFDKRADYPSFKKRASKQSYTTPMNGNSIKVTKDTVTLPKIGAIVYKQHRKIKAGGTLKSATVSREPDDTYYVSLLYEYPETVWITDIDTSRIIGLDMSMSHFFIDSDGCTADMPHYYRLMKAKLAREQTKLSMMKKGSNNYRKQKRRVAKLYAKTKRQRSDFLHKLSYYLVNAYDVICIEDLNMKGMSRGLHLGKSVHDNGWGTFTSMLEYKCRKYGKVLIKVDRFYPSGKTCRSCGHIHKELSLDDCVYKCPVCGSFMDRDWQAALNLADEGLRIYNSQLAA